MSYLSLIRVLTKKSLAGGVNFRPIQKSIRFVSFSKYNQTDEFKYESRADTNPKSEEKIKEEILEIAMKYVPIYGFSVQSLLEGIQIY